MKRLDSKRLKARELRSQGETINRIAHALSVSKGSVSVWVRDVPLDDLAMAKIAECRRQQGVTLNSYLKRTAGARLPAMRKAITTNRTLSPYQQIFRKKKLTERRVQIYQQRRQEAQRVGYEAAGQMDPLHIQGCMIFWAEGTKSTNSLEIINTDPEMLCVFVKFLRLCLKVPDDRIRMRVVCRLDNGLSIDEVEGMWLEKLKLKSSNLYRSCVIPGDPDRVKRLIYGSCYLYVRKSWKDVQHIFGAIQRYGGFSRPSWSKGKQRVKAKNPKCLYVPKKNAVRI